MRKQINDSNAMKLGACITIGIILTTASVRAENWYYRWDGAGKTWFEKWNNVLNIVDTLSLEEKMEMLGKGVTLGLNGLPSGEKKEIFTRAQSMLLAIPGHAIYYQNQIEEVREQVKECAKLPQEEQFRLQRDGEWKGPGDYEDVRSNAFHVLRLLPSPQTVAVLGHFLEDPERRDGRNLLGDLIGGSDALPQAPNCGKAYIAISNLGIEHPPAKGTPPYPDDLDYDLDRVDKWKDWWGEVKAGKRTYRFTGSDIEYGPDGPATKEQLEKIAKDRKRTEVLRKGRHGSSSVAGSVSSKAPLVASVLAGFTVLASLVWYFRKAAK